VIVALVFALMSVLALVGAGTLTVLLISTLGGSSATFTKATAKTAAPRQVALVKLAGVVTLDGKPAANLLVTFLPEDGFGQKAEGWTDANGIFQLTTSAENDGACPGDYKVVVQGDERVLTARRHPAKPPSSFRDLSAKYSDPGKTILRQRVPPEGRVRLELKSEGP
jgi:hypothetical protein